MTVPPASFTRSLRARGRVLALATTVMALVLVGCASLGGPETKGQLTVFAAASLTNAFDEIDQAFEAENPSVKVFTNYGGSSQLATQLVEGASADVFASADQAQMEVAEQAGRIDGSPLIFATNHLVVILPADNPGRIEGLGDLTKPGLKIVMAVPGVPVREYTDRALAALSTDPAYGKGFNQGVLANLASEEQNVRQVAAKVALGEADAGFVYTSDVTPDISGKVQEISIPEFANPTAQYPIAGVADATNPGMAHKFIEFVLSSKGQAILAKWGFGHAP